MGCKLSSMIVGYGRLNGLIESNDSILSKFPESDNIVCSVGIEGFDNIPLVILCWDPQHCRMDQSSLLGTTEAPK